ncbi:hypothetical protein [Rhodopila globiformis]|uniref:Uncharacterized protein n=1 Tax=Rhodopila globiformis TaxID=1071 RepID=A0A2S6NGH7_RHOGL|nr:hypothetical protein [Rhodopila globiformis]PPQ33707.1 hypothetical protein CCS01_13625 [Rhodopila globiformis]
MAFFDDYKPFRNHLRKFPLLPSLVEIWRLSLDLLYDRPLPPDYLTGRPALAHGPLNKYLYPWDLDILSRELLLNASTNGTRTLKKWSDLANTINYIRRLEDVAFTTGHDPQADVLRDLHRIAHRQWPWQIDAGAAPLMRALKVFGTEAVDRLVVQTLGMTIKQAILLGSAVSGSFLNNSGMSINQDYGVLGIPRDASIALLSRLTSTTSDLRREIVAQQRYDQDWAYGQNPLEKRPLISVDPSFPDRVLCPMPWWLMRRLSGGIFYDLVSLAEFSNPFGESFQDYVGDIIKLTCKPPRFTILPEEPYFVGQRKMHGVDWTVSDHTGHLFVEAKAKRLTVGSKVRSETAPLDRDLNIMAMAIVQHYQNIRRSLDRQTSWKPDGLPIYPLILTLEDWFFISPRVNEMLTAHIGTLLAKADVPASIVESMPYIIASAQEFEIISQLISQIGINPILSRCIEPDRQSWALLPIVRGFFKDELKNADGFLFRAEFMQLWQNIYANHQ